jgi:hypothetical protein
MGNDSFNLAFLRSRARFYREYAKTTTDPYFVNLYNQLADAFDKKVSESEESTATSAKRRRVSTFGARPRESISEKGS